MIDRFFLLDWILQLQESREVSIPAENDTASCPTGTFVIGRSLRPTRLRSLARSHPSTGLL